jgi:hypothetical protein
MDEGDGHAAFAHSTGYSFDGVMARVAGAEDAWQAGLQRERVVVVPAILFANVYAAFVYFRRNRMTPAKTLLPTFSQLGSASGGEPSRVLLAIITFHEDFSCGWHHLHRSKPRRLLHSAEFHFVRQ